MARTAVLSFFCLVGMHALFLDHLFVLPAAEIESLSWSSEVIERGQYLQKSLDGQVHSPLPSNSRTRKRAWTRHVSVQSSRRRMSSEMLFAPVESRPIQNKMDRRKRIHSPLRRQLTSRGSRNDRDVLEEFKRAIVPSQMAFLSTWNATENPDFCSGWKGVTCDKTGRVRMLALPQAGLSGTLSPALGNLSFLLLLDLSGNHFRGYIPISLSRCSTLYRLDLSSNELSGEIPSEFTQLHSLKFLNLSDNNFLEGTSIPPELGNMSSLQTLDLSSNNFTGPVPSQLERLTNLNFLQIGWNQLSGAIPTALANCTNLKTLDVTRNQLSGVIPSELGSLGNLKVLSLAVNYLDGSIPTDLSNCTHLMFLSVSQNRLTGKLPPELGRLHFLQVLDLLENNLIGGIPLQLGSMISLQWLSIGSNNLTGNLPIELSNCSGLIFLYVNKNQINGIIPDEIGRLKKLQRFSVVDNMMAGEIPGTLGNCSQLQILQLARNQLTGTLPLVFSNLNQLQYLDASENQLHGEISRVPDSLLVLDLHSNKLRGDIPVWVWGLGALQILDLSNNYLTGDILPGSSPIALAGMKVVNSSAADIIIDISHIILLYIQGVDSIGNNNFVFKGYAFQYEAVPPYLAILDLSSNRLSGDIPSSIGTLVQLGDLNLSNNLFTGSLSASMGSLRELESLDLSGNKLHGPIPSSLASLTSLAILRLANNNLSGRIPFGAQLQTFSISSFKPGNTLLCGPLVGDRCITGNMTPWGTGGTQWTSLGKRWFSNVLSVPAFEIGISLGFISIAGLLILNSRARIALFALLGLNHGPNDNENSFNRVYGVFKDPIQRPDEPGQIRIT